MAFMSWNEKMSVGIPLVDADHKLLIELINQLDDSIGDPEEKAVLGSVLDALIDYTIYHFSREEKVMEAAGFPGIAGHVGEHRALTAKVRDIQRRHLAGGGEVMGPEVMAFLKDWLTRHILESDMAYRTSVQGNADAIKAADSVPRLAPQSGAASDEEAVAATDWGRLNVLVVDDNANFRRIARTILESVRVSQVWEAINGGEALDLLRDFDADVVLCDWRMAGMDGIEFVSRLRAQGSDLPVVMMTGYGDDEFRQQAIKSGVGQFIEKPVTARGVLVSVARALAGSNGAG